jgi:7-cyano-7-deazaguanine synthase
MNQNNDDSGAVVLLSGGLDSSVLLAHTAKTLEEGPIHGLSFSYGQRHVKELACARWQAEWAGIARHHVIPMDFLGPLLSSGTALVEGGDAVPDLETLSDEERSQPPTYVPNRNMLLLSLAAAYAEAEGMSKVYYGAQAQDEYGYWDCTHAFLERINALLKLNRKTPVQIQAPFMDKSKAEIVTTGLELKVNFAQTWSCYRGGEKPCGECPTCVERRHAFEGNGMTDPLEQ